MALSKQQLAALLAEKAKHGEIAPKQSRGNPVENMHSKPSFPHLPDLNNAGYKQNPSTATYGSISGNTFKFPKLRKLFK